MKFSDDMDAILFLEKQGYTLTRKFCWIRPDNKPEPSDDENAALDYLFNEWDYGGVIGLDVVTEKRNESVPSTPLSAGGVNEDHRETGSGPWGRDFVPGVQSDARQALDGDSKSEAPQSSGDAWDAFPKVG